MPSMKVRRLAATLMLAAVGAAAPFTAALAEPSEADTPPTVQYQRYQVDEFRSTYPGMTLMQVLDAATNDFADEKAVPEFLNGPGGMLHALVLHVADLQPSLGPATVSFVFDDKTNLLHHVDVVRVLD